MWTSHSEGPPPWPLVTAFSSQAAPTVFGGDRSTSVSNILPLYSEVTLLLWIHQGPLLLSPPSFPGICFPQWAIWLFFPYPGLKVRKIKRKREEKNATWRGNNLWFITYIPLIYNILSLLHWCFQRSSSYWNDKPKGSKQFCVLNSEQLQACCQHLIINAWKQQKQYQHKRQILPSATAPG